MFFYSKLSIYALRESFQKGISKSKLLTILLVFSKLYFGLLAAAAHVIVNESNGLFNKYIENGTYQKHLYNKKNLLNDWFVVKSAR